MTDPLVLFGRQHGVPERIHAAPAHDAGRRSAAALCAGTYRAIQRKGGNDTPNEDALLLVDDGRHALHALCDGHYGTAASHGWIERIEAALAAAPDCAALVDDLAWAQGTWDATEPAEPPSAKRPGTTLVIALLDRARGQVRGVSVGDSGAFLLRSNGEVKRLDDPQERYLRAPRTAGFEAAEVRPFEARVAAGDGLLTCSDGVFECHYDRPATSIQAGDLARLWLAGSLDAEGLARGITEAALAGVRGNPGGEDNIGVLVSTVTRG